jgi:glycosyltransferase involved in cell wall biosynthesis
MKTLYYISIPAFVLVDLAIIPLLSIDFHITYSLLWPKQSNDTSKQEIKTLCSQYGVGLEIFSLKRRLRDIRIAHEFSSLVRHAKKTRPDIIYTIAFDVPILSILLLAFAPKRTIIALHDVEFHTGTRYSFLLMVGRRLLMSRFSNFQVFSNNQSTIFKYKYPYKKLYCIPLSLGYYGDMTISCKQHRSSSDTTNFLFFGRILPYKGLHKLITAANHLASRNLNFTLTIAGQCDDWAMVYEPHTQQNDHINKIIRFIDNNELTRIFMHADYLVLPYTDCTQSGPLMLAYTFNLPIIASSVPHFRELIKEDVTGYLFDLDRPQQLEEVMEQAILRPNKSYQELTIRMKQHIGRSHSPISIVPMYSSMFLSVAND